MTAYSSVKGAKTVKEISNWGFIRCPPASAAQFFHAERGASLAVLMGVNEYDVNFLVDPGLGNAVYSQRLKHILTESQWNRMFGDSPGVNEERAGDSVKICGASLLRRAVPVTPTNFGCGGTLVRTMQGWSAPFVILLP